MSGRRTLSEIFTVVREPSLEPGPKALWVLYRSYDGKGRGAFPGDERVAEHLGVSPRTVQRWRTELIASGYLRQKLDGPKPARYHAVIPKRDDTHVESSPNKDSTPVSGQAGERDDTPVESLTEDTTEDATSDATSDATQVAPHSSTDEYGRVRTSTSVPSLRSGTARQPNGTARRDEHEAEDLAVCPSCGALTDGPNLGTCLACHRQQAGLPSGASRGGGPGGHSDRDSTARAVS